MSHYRPTYSNNTPTFHDLPPPPQPPDMPPLPREPPPPPIDSYRNGGSWRPQPPQSDFSFRNQDFAPQYPREREPDHYRPTRSRQYAMQNGHQDRRKFNRPRGGRGQAYRPRQRVAPSDRPLLQQRGNDDDQEEMLGVTDGARKFMPAEDISDSDEEEMDESDSDQGDNDIDLEPPAKRRAIASTPAGDEAAFPKWSNPDPYTVLPPTDDAQRKRKDPVKLIRKAREQMVSKATEKSQVAANDDFISFGNEEEDRKMAQESASDADSPHGENGTPTANRSFSHLQNLHSQADRQAPGTSLQNTNEDLGTPPGLQQDTFSKQNEIVLDLGSAHRDNSRGDNDYALDYDQSLGSRKRTYRDVIKPDPRFKKNSAANADGSLLRDWMPGPSTDPAPWLKRTSMLTANAGFKLHKEICDFYDFVKPQKHEQIVREDLLSRLQNVIRREIPDCNVHCFGSFAAGLYLPNADMDVVIVSDEFRRYGRKFICQTKNKMFKFANFLRGFGIARADSVEVIFGAKVPLVKFIDRITAIKVDMSFENDTGIVANDTFTAWKGQYPAMPILVTVIKQFLMMRGLNEVQHGGLGGFSVTCLVTSLLQNMPRVQAGELIPEENLGEILVEFFDFYGNCLDTSRTGIMMNPPGYFDKRAFDRRSIGRGPVYQASKADRLAIMDPNVPENDISGGSRNVMLIFDRFSKAHSEILAAMKANNRPCLLDWALGGNYDSFEWQRNHLLCLYERDSSYHTQGPEPMIYPSGPSRRLAVANPTQIMQNIIAPGETSTFVENRITETGLGTDPMNGTSQKDVKSTHSGAETLSSKKAMMKAKVKLGNINRACQIRKDYPDMPNVPDAITVRKRLTLIKKHERRVAKAARKAAVRDLSSASRNLKIDAQSKEPASEDPATHEMLPLAAESKRSQAPTPVPQDSFAPLASDQSIAPKKSNAEIKADKSRAKTLRDRFPGVEVPVLLDKAAFKIWSAKLAAAAPVVPVKRVAPTKNSARLANLPPRPMPPKPAQGTAKTRQFHRRNETSVHEIPEPWTEDYVPTRGNAMGGRMAPPTNERRAEVARNLQGISNSDPIQID